MTITLFVVIYKTTDKYSTHFSTSIEDRNKELDYLRDLYLTKTLAPYNHQTKNIDSIIENQELLIYNTNKQLLKRKQ
jgi:hypothetical protein